QYDLETAEVIDDPHPKMKLYSLKPKDSGTVREGIMLLGISAQERALLADAATVVLSPYHGMNVVLTEQQPDQGEEFESGGVTYRRFAVTVRGLHKDTFRSFDVEPLSEILVYSRDGLVFVSGQFDLPQFFPTTYTPTHEELRAHRPEPATVLASATAIQGRINAFTNAVNISTIPDDPDAASALALAITATARQLWDDARTYRPNGYCDDRTLYWARLKMAEALKRHPRLLKNSAERNTLVRLLEENTRGFVNAEFSNNTPDVKKILLVAFDPYGLGGAGITNANISGIIALGLHGESVQSSTTTGVIHSLILPVRYADFDDGMIEQLFAPFMHGDNRAHMILTTNMNGEHGIYSLERFAGRRRTGALPDNDDRKSTIVVGVGTDWKEFYPMSLPVTAIMAGRKSATPSQSFFYDQSFLSSADTTHVSRPGIDSDADNLESNADITPTGVAIRGSGGSYLSNELFYRLAHLREHSPSGGGISSTVIGHLDLPAIGSSGPASTSAINILNEVKTTIERALDNI
ncbi:MAG: hypothetical protein ABIR47_00405, partial [Candidatus Kapaibacterium sp.]